ncbi:hypothetical protein NBRC116188_15360 [Oceaniserpentilla sp. 4NH20-0058]
MDGLNSNIKISVPEIQQNRLSFCDNSISGFEAWCKKLPMGNIGAAAKLLFQAGKELNQTELNSALRYKMLEIMRTQVYTICELLSKRYLNQSVILNDNELKIVKLAQTLQNQLATGYKHIILELANTASKKKNHTPKLLTFAIHRAISDINQTLLRAFQLYSSAPKNAWLDLHQLYALAESKNLQLHEVKDSQTKFRANSSIFDVYTRALLLGSSKPNQLRQSEQANLFAATELWSNLLKLSTIKDTQAQFLYVQNNDRAPIYRSLVKSVPSGAIRTFDTTELVSALQKSLYAEKVKITIPGNLSSGLINHLLHAWGGMKERSFRRMKSSGQVNLAIGFLSSHYFCAKEKSFTYLLQKWHLDLAENKQAKVSEDIWDNSFDAGNLFTGNSEDIEFDSVGFLDKNAADQEDSGPKGKNVNALIINTSPGGYGISLSNPPASMQTGELVAIKEPKVKDWCIGSIRWIRTLQNQPAQIGIELLAPKAEPVAVRLLNKTGEHGEFIRGIRIPAFLAAGQKETLVLPTIPFKVGSKAEMADDRMQQRIQLTKHQSVSRSFVQYEYQSLTQVSSDTQESSQDNQDEFKSIWDKL